MRRGACLILVLPLVVTAGTESGKEPSGQRRSLSLDMWSGAVNPGINLPR